MSLNNVKIDPKNTHTFNLSYTFADGITEEGQFTVKRLSIADRSRMGVRRSQLAGGLYCFTPDTYVLGDTVRPIADIEVGDLVFGHDGKLHKVTELFEREYTGPMRAIKARGIFPTTCTPDHQFLVVKPYRTSSGTRLKPSQASSTVAAMNHYETQPVWVKACEIEAGDYLLMPKAQIQADGEESPEWIWRSALNTTAIQLCEKIHPTKDLAWTFGLFAAEGSTNATESETIFTLSLTADYERAAAALRTLGASVRVTSYDNHRTVSVKSRTLTKSFRQWFGPNSQNKKLPYFLFHGWDLESALEGVLHGDGSVLEDDGMKLSTTSKVLALQVCQIAQTLGHYPTVYWPKRYSGYPNAKQLYDVVWFNGDRHRNIRIGKNLYGIEVTSIDDVVYSGVVHNIEVDEVHSYLTEGAIAHNCVRDSEGKPTGMGLDEDTDFLNMMRAHLEIALIQKPVWFDFETLSELGVLEKIYEKVLEFENKFFRSRGRTSTGDESDRRREDNGVSKSPEQVNVGNLKEVVGSQVSASLDA